MQPTEEQRADRFDRYLGLAYVAERWHSGQWSDLYRLFCRATKDMRRTDSACNLRPRDEYYQARHYAARYLLAVRSRLARNCLNV